MNRWYRCCACGRGQNTTPTSTSVRRWYSSRAITAVVPFSSPSGPTTTVTADADAADGQAAKTSSIFLGWYLYTHVSISNARKVNTDDLPNMRQFECVCTARVDGRCVSIAASAQAVVVSRQFDVAACHPGRAAEYATNPEFSEWAGASEDEYVNDVDSFVDGDLVVLTPDTLQQVRVIGSDINPLGAFRFWKASYDRYTCGLAFEPTEGLLLVADGCNGAVHVVDVLRGTHAGFAATPRMCEDSISGIAVKQTSSSSCVAAFQGPRRVFLVSHGRGGPWDLLSAVDIWGCPVYSLHFFGSGLSFFCAPVDGQSVSLQVFTSGIDDVLHFEHREVKIDAGKWVYPLFPSRAVQTSESTWLFACLGMVGHRCFVGSFDSGGPGLQFRLCGAEWLDCSNLEWAHVPDAGLVTANQKFDKVWTSPFVLVRRFVAVMSLHRLAWMSACVRACVRACDMHARRPTAYRQCNAM